MRAHSVMRANIERGHGGHGAGAQQDMAGIIMKATEALAFVAFVLFLACIKFDI